MYNEIIKPTGGPSIKIRKLAIFNNLKLLFQNAIIFMQNKNQRLLPFNFRDTEKAKKVHGDVHGLNGSVGKVRLTGESHDPNGNALFFNRLFMHWRST